MLSRAAVVAWMRRGLGSVGSPEYEQSEVQRLDLWEWTAYSVEIAHQDAVPFSGGTSRGSARVLLRYPSGALGRSIAQESNSPLFEVALPTPMGPVEGYGCFSLHQVRLRAFIGSGEDVDLDVWGVEVCGAIEVKPAGEFSELRLSPSPVHEVSRRIADYRRAFAAERRLEAGHHLWVAYQKARRELEELLDSPQPKRRPLHEVETMALRHRIACEELLKFRTLPEIREVFRGDERAELERLAAREHGPEMCRWLYPELARDAALRERLRQRFETVATDPTADGVPDRWTAFARAVTETQYQIDVKLRGLLTGDELARYLAACAKASQVR